MIRLFRFNAFYLLTRDFSSTSSFACKFVEKMNSLWNTIFVLCTIGLFSVNGFIIPPEYYGLKFPDGESQKNHNFIMQKFLRNGASSTTTTLKPETTTETGNEPEQFLINWIIFDPIFYNGAEQYSYLQPQNTGSPEATPDIQSYSLSDNDRYPLAHVSNAEYASSDQLQWPLNFYSRTIYNYPPQSMYHPLTKSPCGDGFYTDDESFNPRLCNLIRALMNINPSTTANAGKRVTTKFTPPTTKPVDNLIELRVLSQSTEPATTSSVTVPSPGLALRAETTSSTKNHSQLEVTTNAKVITYFQDANDNLCMREIVKMPGKVITRYTCTEKDFNENKISSSPQLPDTQNVANVFSQITKSTTPVAGLNTQTERTTSEMASSTENDSRFFLSAENTVLSTGSDSGSKLVTKNVSEVPSVASIVTPSKSSNN